MLEHVEVKERHEETLKEDGREEVQLLAVFEQYHPAFVDMIEQLSNYVGLIPRAYKHRKHYIDQLNDKADRFITPRIGQG